MKISVTTFFIFIFFFPAIGQFCTGSLSEPIVNMTFGTVAKPIAGNTSFDYTQGCPQKGQYTIKSLSFGCGDRTWLMIAGDHTRDVNGQYMLVNGSGGDGIVYIDTVSGLCSGFAYQFTAWVTNVMQKFSCDNNPVLPNLTFTVETLDKTILETYNTGDIPITEAKQFKQYGLLFKLRSSINSVVLKIKSNSENVCGAAFAIDDIFLNLCGPLASATLDGDEGPKEVCAEYKDHFILKSEFEPGFINPEIQWQQSLDYGKTWANIPGATNSLYAIPRRSSDAILFRFLVAEKGNITLPNCRVVSNSILTNIHPVPDHQAPQNIIGCLNKDLALPKTDPKALDILWSGPNNYTSTLTKSSVLNVQTLDAGLYQLKQNFHYGCSSLDTFFLQVFPGTTISTETSYAICESETIQLNAVGQGTFEWFPNIALSNNRIANPLSIPKDSINYKVVLTNSFGCKDSANVEINVYRKPQVFAGNDLKIETGDTIKLDKAWAKGTDINITWSPNLFINPINELNPIVYPVKDIVYTLTATSNLGCGAATDEISVKVFKDVFVPNAFTPNGDGLNDVFRIYAGDGYQVKHCDIYNRWGNKIFSSADINFSWDGRWLGQLQPSGTFVYYLELEKQNGKKIIKKGTIALIR